MFNDYYSEDSVVVKLVYQNRHSKTMSSLQTSEQQTVHSLTTHRAMYPTLIYGMQLFVK